MKSVSLNGNPVVDWKIRHADIVKGGTLVFEMGAASRVPRDPQQATSLYEIEIPTKP